MRVVSAALIPLVFVLNSSGDAPSDHGRALLILGSSQNGYAYAYAPGIIRSGGKYHLFYCSSPVGSGLDSIRYSNSRDATHWSSPIVVLKATRDNATCDPAVVKHNFGDGNFYYLFYSGTPTGTAMYVARARKIDGPYLKLTNEAKWVENALQPQIIIGPQKETHGKNGWYGAGQQSVVAVGGRLLSWYFDDTAAYPERLLNSVLMTSATSATTWTRPVNTNVTDAISPEVKYDPKTRRYVMFYIGPHHGRESALWQRHSSDGVSWSEATPVRGSDTFPDYAHNVGVLGNEQGHLLSGIGFVAYGAPYGLRPDYTNNCQTGPNCWGAWDLYGTFLQK